MDLEFTHMLLPKQSIATEAEVQELTVKFGITKKNLPKMKSDDPAAKALNAQSGDVIKCLRISRITQKEEAYFRVVVEA